MEMNGSHSTDATDSTEDAPIRRRKVKDLRIKILATDVKTTTVPLRRAAAAAAQALIKHLMFIRQQIPMPYDQLRAQVREHLDAEEDPNLAGPARRRPSAMVKKSRKLVEATDAVLEGISALFDREEVAGLLISAGPTPINPREAYILRVEPPAANEPVLDEQAAKKAESGVARSLVRTMVTCGLDQLDLQTMPTKIYVLALIKADSTRPFDAGGGDTDTPQSWMPKQSFTPKLRRCRPVLITVGTKGFCTQPCPTELAGVATSPEGGEGHDGVRTLVQETGVVPETAGGGGSQESEGESAFWWVQHAQVMRGLPRESRE